MFATVVNDLQVQTIPSFLGKQRLQVGFGLDHAFAVG
jgi:hypothetical protein